MSAASQPFVPPSAWRFRPFFTLQPVAETREKQLRLWRELILSYHEHHRQYSMSPSSFPLFRNEALDRQLPPEGIEAVVSSLLAAREAEWEDAATRSNLLVYWKTPEALARDIASWAAQKLSKFDCVVAVVELHSDEDSPFLGVDPAFRSHFDEQTNFYLRPERNPLVYIRDKPSGEMLCGEVSCVDMFSWVGWLGGHDERKSGSSSDRGGAAVAPPLSPPHGSRYPPATYPATPY